MTTTEQVKILRDALWDARAVLIRSHASLSTIQACSDALAATVPAAIQPAGEAVAVIGSDFQLLYCREDWSKGLKVGDVLYLAAPQDEKAEQVETAESFSAQAYDYACDLMESGWAERAKRGVEIGTQGSLCDGIAWIFDHMKKLESKSAPIEAGEMPKLPEPLEIDWPELHSQALGCGVEDRNLHNRYECAEYGWQDGVDRAIERVPDAIYDADQMRAYGQLCRDTARPASSVTSGPMLDDRDAQIIIRAIIGLRDGWGLRGDAQYALDVLGKYRASINYPATKPASTGSVADDTEFRGLAYTHRTALVAEDWDAARLAWAALCAYIDARQSVAAPYDDNAEWTRKLAREAAVCASAPIATFEGYVDGKERIKWTGEPLPVGTQFYAVGQGKASDAEDGSMPPLPEGRMYDTPAGPEVRFSKKDMREYAIAYRSDDGRRIDFIESHPEKQLRYHKKRWSFIGFTNYEYEVFKTLREAIDAARAQQQGGRDV